MLDVYSRKIVGHEVYHGETGELASEFIEKAYWREYIPGDEREASGAAFRQRQPHEGLDLPGETVRSGYYALEQSAPGQ